MRMERISCYDEEQWVCILSNMQRRIVTRPEVTGQQFAGIKVYSLARERIAATADVLRALAC